jgi:DNA-binding NtrC family response regulator
MATMNLLLVDDEQRFLSTTKVLLEKRGVATWTAAGGPAALAVLAAQRIDVVVLDVKMPGMDGLEVLKRIKQDYPLVEVILLTGHASVESAVEGLQQGAFDYLMKPCDVSDLINEAEKACARKRDAEDQARKSQIDKIISHPLAVFDDEDD